MGNIAAVFKDCEYLIIALTALLWIHKTASILPLHIAWYIWGYDVRLGSRPCS